MQPLRPPLLLPRPIFRNYPLLHNAASWCKRSNRVIDYSACIVIVIVHAGRSWKRLHDVSFTRASCRPVGLGWLGHRGVTRLLSRSLLRAQRPRSFLLVYVYCILVFSPSFYFLYCLFFLFFLSSLFLWGR